MRSGSYILKKVQTTNTKEAKHLKVLLFNLFSLKFIFLFDIEYVLFD